MPPGIIIPLQLNISHVSNQLNIVSRQIQRVQRQAGGGGFGAGGGGRGPSTFGSRLASAIYSTRFNAGGGASPLVGRTLDILGMKGNLAGLALASMALAANKAADALNSFRAAMFTSGGTPEEQATLGGLGKAIGLSGMDMSQMARDFAEAITHDPMALGLAGRAGIRDMPGYFGKVDKAQNLIKWIDALSKMPAQEAIRAARATHTEGLLGLRDLSPGQRQKIIEDSKVRAETFTSSGFRDARDFMAAMGRLSDAFQNFVVGFGQPIIKILTWFLNKTADVLNWFSGDPAKGGKGLFETPQEQQAKARMKQQDQHVKALDRNTQALEGLNGSLREGMFGGGERARGAIPSRWLGLNSHRYAAEAAKLGAFAL